MATVVFFGAHADDIEIGAGGTCAKLAAAGFEVHVVIATDEADPAIAERRREEARAAARNLGIRATRVHFLGHPDGDLRSTRAAVGALRKLFNEKGLKPTAVFTHTDVDSHNDHVELTRLVRATFRGTAIFKYIVRNSAIVSHFHPTLYSRVDGMLGAKARALVSHTSQVAAGRVSVDRLLEFSKRYTVAEDSVHLEAFEVEIQEGAGDLTELMDVINDAPFSRFWLPIYQAGDLTILAGDGSRVLWPTMKVTPSSAPGTLELVATLQSMLLATFAAESNRNLRTFVRVAPRSAALPADVPSGTMLILGSQSNNPATAVALAQMQPLRLRVEPASGRRAAPRLHDLSTDRSRRVLLPPTRQGLSPGEFAGDFGLITIGRTERADGTSAIAILLDGSSRSGFSAAFRCLISAEALAGLAPQAREVTTGNQRAAQWMMPATTSGEPLLEGMEYHPATARSGASRRPKSPAVAKTRTTSSKRAA